MPAAKDQFRLVIDRAELDRLLTSTSSPVAFDLAKRAQRVAASAKRRAPRKTGATKASIAWQMGSDDQGLFADVGSTVPYARPLENGHRMENGKRVSPRRFLRPALYASASKRRRSTS
jgi:bacteriophage HK97-gp10 putative tail-component